MYLLIHISRHIPVSNIPSTRSLLPTVSDVLILRFSPFNITYSLVVKGGCNPVTLVFITEVMIPVRYNAYVPFNQFF